MNKSDNTATKTGEKLWYGPEDMPKSDPVLAKAAVGQLENRPIGKIQIGDLLAHLQAIGYDVDEQWAADTLAAGLPPVQRTASTMAMGPVGTLNFNE